MAARAGLPSGAPIVSTPRVDISPHAARSPFSQMLRALDLANLPDADVVTLALEGREAAHRELIKRYERPVFSLVFRMVRDRELAEDLTQDTFVKVLSNLERYRADFKFSSWLFK